MAVMAGELTRRRLLLGAGVTLCSACARWPAARAGSIPSRRIVVLMAGEHGLLGGNELELALYDDGWAYLWDWDGAAPHPEVHARHTCLRLEASEVEGWTRRLHDPALVALPRHYEPEGMVLDGGSAYYGRPADPFTFFNADTTHAPILALRDHAQALFERLREHGVDALRDPGLPARARLLVRHLWARDRGTPLIDDLRIYDGGLLDYRLLRARKREEPGEPRGVPHLRELDPAALEPLRGLVRDTQSVGTKAFLGDAPRYASNFISVGGAFITVHSADASELPAPLAALLEELIALRGYYYDDDVRGR